jgi:transcriptional regulator NrdR family protein
MSSFKVDEMYVLKRDGNKEIISFDKILQRIKNTGKECNVQINFTSLAMKVIDQLYDGISTTQLDELTAEHLSHQHIPTTIHLLVESSLVIIKKTQLNRFPK